MSKKKAAVFFALLAAALYAINVPFSKLLQQQGVGPTMLAGFLYIGAGMGIGVLMLYRKFTGHITNQAYLKKADLPYTVAMVVLDIAAPILLMQGIEKTNAANVSLLNNFEIVATSVISLAVFKEKISRMLWGAIALVVVSGGILGFEGTHGFALNEGSLYVLGACLCWGIENNCTRTISDKSSEQIVLVKGLGSGTGSIIVALCVGESFPSLIQILLTMLLGFVAYGLSINFYIMAQKDIGAAKTSAFYSVAPFLGVGFSFLFLGEMPQVQFWPGLAVMLMATVLMAIDTLGTKRSLHGYTHSHTHRHGDIVHTHSHRHTIFNPLHMHLHSHK